jgi:hypothetical protein
MASNDALKAAKKQLNSQKKLMAKSAKGKKKTEKKLDKRAKKA